MLKLAWVAGAVGRLSLLAWQRAWMACTTFIVVACITGSEVPKPTAMHLLEADTTEPDEALDRRLKIIHFGPEGGASAKATVSVVFNKPLRDLSSSDTSPLPPIVLSPAIEGTWQWIGTQAVQFQPATGSLPPATAFKVDVAPTVRALDGEQLAQAHQFSFTTPTARLVEHFPADDAEGMALDSRIVLSFNHPVTEASLAELAVVRAGETRIPFTLQRPEEDAERRWILVPKRALPRAARIHIEIPAGLASTQGDLPSSDAFQFSFQTYGPLQTKVRCGWSDCHPQATVLLDFTNPVKVADVKARVSLAPAVKIHWPEWYSDDEMVHSIGFEPQTVPRTTYSVSLAPGLTDAYAQQITGARQFSFRTGDYPEALAIGIAGTVLQPEALRAVPIRSRNVANYQVTLGSASPAFAIAFQDRPWELNFEELANRRTFTVSPGVTNQYHDQLLQLVPVLDPAANAATARGLIAVRASYPSQDSTPIHRQHLAQVTDLGLTAKLSAHGTLVWVTRLSTGASVAGASVELWQDAKATHTFVTNSEGKAVIPREVFSPRFYEEERNIGIVVRADGDWTAQSVRSFIGPWSMPIAPQLHSEAPLSLFLFTERGLYRPGDDVWVKGIVREPVEPSGESSGAGGMAVVSNRPLRLRLVDPQGTKVSERTVTTNTFGTFAVKAAVPNGAALGSWQFAVVLPETSDEASADGGSGALGTANFSVAEYEPAEFDVEVVAARPAYVNGARAGFDVAAQFLFGAPVANAELQYTLSHELTAYKPTDTQAFDTDDDAYQEDIEARSPPAGVIAEGAAKLDQNGRLHLDHALVVKGQTRPRRVRFEASVTDVSRRTLSGSAQALLHPAEHYVGIQRPEQWFVEANARVAPQIAAFTPAGKRLAGKHVDVTLFRRAWTSVREQWEGGYRQVYQRIDEKVGSCQVTTRLEPQTCSLTTTKPGMYLVRAASSDGQGRIAYASQQVYAIGEGPISWRDDADNAAVRLVPDRPQYRVGQTARILVHSPFERAEAMLTIERGGIMLHRQVTLVGATPVVEVPITDAMRPNAYVGLHVLKKRSPGAPVALTGDELYRIGYAELAVDASERVLAVDVKPAKVEVEPGANIVADVWVKDAGGRGKPAEVTVYAVDEGVLALSDYQLPDPARHFTAPRPLRVATLENRSDLARILNATQMSGAEKGMGLGGGGDMRMNFEQSAYFAPAILTDENGRARVEFKAPDNLTTYRLMAVAVSKDDRYGSGFSKVTVNKPLMARPALPRVLRAGDRFKAAVVVSTKDAKSSQVSVSLDVTGAGLTGKRTQQVRVVPTGVAEVSFDVEAPVAGDAVFTFGVQGTAERDTVRISRRVLSPGQMQTVAAYGATEGVEGQRLGDLEQLRPDAGGLEIGVGSTRLVGLTGSLELLANYPYACTEQVASRLLPALPLADIARAFGFEVNAGSTRDAGAAVGTLLKRQRSDGGFGFWPESPVSHPFVSAYTLWVLKLAQDRGQSISDAVFLRGAAYLRSLLNSSGAPDDTSPGVEQTLEARAFAAFVLATLGKPDPGAIERLIEERAALTTLGHAWLVMAAVEAKLGTNVRMPLVKHLESSITAVGNRAIVKDEGQQDEVPHGDVLLSSASKVQASVLSALLAHDAKHPLAGKLVTELLAHRQGGTWRTTQDSAFSLLAIDRYWRAQERQVPHFEAAVWLGEKPLFSQAFVERSTAAEVVSVDMKALRNAGTLDLVFQRKAAKGGAAAGTLFYEARLSYVPTVLPATPLDRGFAVHKSVRAVTPTALASATASIGTALEDVPAGDFALVDLTVVVPEPRRYVVVDDPLPAGYVAFDASLATSSARVAELEATQVESTGFSTAWYRRELRDDRVLFFIDEMPAGMYHYRYLARATTPGTYVVPPTRVMEMYQPEVYGRTAAWHTSVLTQDP